MELPRGHLLFVQWFLLILPLCIAGMALYPSVMTVFFSGNPQGAAITVFYALVTGLLVVGCMATALATGIWFKTRQRPWRIASAWLGLSSATIGLTLIIIVPMEFIFIGFASSADPTRPSSAYYFQAPGFMYVYVGTLTICVLLFVMGCIALVRQKVIYPLPGQAPYQHPVPMYPASHQVEMPTPSTSPRHLHIGNPGGTLPPA